MSHGRCLQEVQGKGKLWLATGANRRSDVSDVSASHSVTYSVRLSLSENLGSFWQRFFYIFDKIFCEVFDDLLMVILISKTQLSSVQLFFCLKGGSRRLAVSATQPYKSMMGGQA